jgi:GNAT superfamily N-acetyltransferase
MRGIRHFPFVRFTQGKDMSNRTLSTDPAPVIRRAEPADAPSILALVRALADYEKLPPPDAAAQARLIADAFAERPRFEVFLAIVDGQAVGYAFIFETYSTFLALPTLYLEDIFVLEAFRGHKIGYALFQFCVAEAQRRGCGRMEWTVLDWNTPSINFYQRQGARHLAEWHLYRLTADQFETAARPSI